MMLSFKYRLNPSRSQAAVLEEQLRLCRWTYNTLLGHCFDERKAGRGTPRYITLQNLLPAMKAGTPELDQVFSQVLQNVAKRVRSGFENYWARRKAGLKAHTPRLRRRSSYNSLTYPQFGFKLEGSTLKLSKIGNISIKLHRPIRGKVRTLTVKRGAAGKLYAVFSCEVEPSPIPNREKAVGIDFGLNSLVALSDGTTFEAPRNYRKAEKRLARLQRIHSRRKRNSRNREKERVKIARLSERVADQRRDFAYKAARNVVNKYERIYVEDLKIQNMQKNRCMGKSIADAGWGTLRGALTYMAHLSEGVIASVDPRDTSQLCSRCGNRVEKNLADRVHICPRCGLVLDRDVNAARNILRKGIGREPPEYTPAGDPAPTLLGPEVQTELMNQEASPFMGR